MTRICAAVAGVTAVSLLVAVAMWLVHTITGAPL
jgi:hypothetical protein